MKKDITVKIIKREKENNVVVLHLEGDITIKYIKKLKEHITKFADNSTKVELDLSNTGMLDSSVYQLLIFLTSESGKYVNKIQIVNPSEIIKNTLSMLGGSLI